jgi:hypothetical protein
MGPCRDIDRHTDRPRHIGVNTERHRERHSTQTHTGHQPTQTQRCTHMYSKLKQIYTQDADT